MTAETATSSTVKAADKPAAEQSPAEAKDTPAKETAAKPVKKTAPRKPAAKKTGTRKTARPRKTAKPAARTATRKPAPRKTAAASKPATRKPTASATPDAMTKDMTKMYKDSMKQFQDMMSEFKGGFADLPLANEEMGKVMEATRDAAVSSMSEFNKELNDFSQARMTECWETAREVLGSKSMPEALEVQSKYVQDVFKAYTEEMQKLNAIAADATQKAWAPLGNGWADNFGKMFTGKSA